MKIGYAYVVADILHKGHILHLENCKALCDKLVVGVLTDEACMEKKPKPILTLEERLMVVKALKCVDAVTIQKRYDPYRTLIEVFPDIVFECEQHEARNHNESEHWRIISMPYFEGISSTNIKKRIRNE